MDWSRLGHTVQCMCIEGCLRSTHGFRALCEWRLAPGQTSGSRQLADHVHGTLDWQSAGGWRYGLVSSSPPASSCRMLLWSLVRFTFDVLLKRHGADFMRVGYCSLLPLQRGLLACASAHLLALTILLCQQGL